MEILGFVAGPYQTNCYLVVEGGTVTVIDPGMNAAERVAAYVEETGAAVDKVVLTHGHIDHTRDAGTISRRYGVPLYIHPLDSFMLVKGEGVSPESQLLFDAQNMEQSKDERPLAEGDRISIGGQDFLVRHAPGHSPGSVLLVGEEVCFSGDVLFRGSIGRTDLPDSSPEDMVATLRDVVLPLPDALTIAPGHGPATTMRAERAGNPFLR